MSANTAALFLNGPAVEWERWPRRPAAAELIACADGGVRLARAGGLKPQLLIGDFDSISPEELQECEKEGVALIRYPAEKDESDLELALAALWQQGCRELYLYGALGGRLDHELANIGSATLFARRGMKIVLVGEQLLGYFLHGPTRLEISGSIGSRLSLLVLTEQAEGVTLSGTQWPLKHETLYFGRARGISNHLTAAAASVTLSHGDLLVLHDTLGN